MPCPACAEGAGASDMRCAQAVQTVSYRLTEHMCACIMELDVISATLIDSCVLFICGV